MYEDIQKYWPLFLLALFLIYQVYDYFSFKALLEKTGRNFCEENEYEFCGIKHAKAHFSVIYKTDENNRRKYKKFRMNALFGRINYLAWLD